MGAVLRAKIRIGNVIDDKNTVNTGDGDKQEKIQERIVAHAVYGQGDVNERWSKWTPSLHLDMMITNDKAWGQLEVGKEYYLDFIPVEGQ